MKWKGHHLNITIRRAILISPLIIIPLLFSAQTLSADSTAPTAPSGQEDQQPDRPALAADPKTWRSIGALVFVLGGLFAVNGWMRKRRFGWGGNIGTQRRMRLLERFALDQKRSLLLVTVDDREMLLGVGNDSITLLRELTGTTASAEPEPVQASSKNKIISMMGITK
jgi:flagellar biosynthetic protein FliO